MMIPKLTAALAVCALALAPVARADDQSYLDRLSHVNTLWLSPQDKLSAGHMIRGWLHNGMSPGDIATQIKAMDGPAIVDAAQHELCPDTLR
jgi:hypothetical protein